MKCVLCNDQNTQLLLNKMSGYLPHTFFKLYHCNNCESNFVYPNKVDQKMYNKIYSVLDSVGYQRYYKYALNITNQKIPLKYLMKQELTYFPIYDYLNKIGNKKLKILEIGCGYGYISYSLKKLGHDITGIDISKPSIDFALKNYGNYFKNIDSDKFMQSSKQKYDLIIATELIEHLTNPTEFLDMCLNQIKKGGTLLITTPNKDYCNQSFHWKTDLPPVHLTWISKKYFTNYAKKNKLGIKFTDFHEYKYMKENYLSSYYFNRKNQIQTPPNFDTSKRKSHIYNIYNQIFIKNGIIRTLCNTAYYLFFKTNNVINTREAPIIGVIIKK